MPYIGRTVVTNLADWHIDNYDSTSDFTAGSTTTLTLTQTGVDEESSVDVYFDGVVQHHDTWSILTSSVITFTSAIPLGCNNVEVRYGTVPNETGIAAGTVATNHLVDLNVTEGKLANLSVTEGKLANLSVAEGKLANNSVTLDKLAGGVDGNIISYDASGNPVAIATGTDGQVLTSAGANLPPAFEAIPASGGLTLISSTDISTDTAEFDFTGFNASAYDNYVIYLMNVTPAEDERYLWMRTSTDGGENYDTGAAHYSWSVLRSNATSDGGIGPNNNLGDSKLALTGNTTGELNQIGSAGSEDGVSGTIWVHGPHLAKSTLVNWQLAFQCANDFSRLNMSLGGGGRQSSANVDAFQILFSSGDIESGTISVYGVKNA